ncbi:MAG: DUF2806 domain-containing protein [Saprospiraceae bacterium]|nr:DUF2806 domain-containing protein [Candidatus Defluviibacterium haderslevense]
MPATKETPSQIVFHISDTYIIANKNQNLPETQIPVLAFTKIGKELLQLVETKVELDYIQLLATKVRQKGIQTIKYATKNQIKNGQIEYSELIDVPLTEEEIKRKEEKMKKRKIIQSS